MMKKCIYLFGFCILLLLNACQEDDEVIQKEEELLPTLEDVEWSYIEEDALSGWDVGFCAEKSYVLVKTDTLDKASIIYVNSFKKGYDGIIVTVDSEERFYTIISNNKTYGLYREGNKVFISEIDEEGNFVNNSSFSYVDDLNDNSRAFSGYTDAEAVRIEKLKKAKEVVGYIDFSLGLAQEFVDRGFWSTVSGELLTLGVSSKLKLLTRSKLVDKLKLNQHDEDCLEEYIDHVEGIVEDTHGNIISGLMGNIGTEIERVYKKRDITGNSIYYVDVRITGINSVPTTWKDFLLRDHENDIYCAVVAGDGFTYWNVYPSYYNCQSMSAEFFIPRNCGSVCKTFAMQGGPSYGTIKFRPLVISSKERASEVNVFFPRGQFIEYGTPWVYENKYGSIYWCETTSVYYESDKVQFKGYVEVNSNCEDDERWGIYYINDNGLPMHFELHNSNVKRSLVQFTQPVDKLLLDYDKWIATYAEELGVYRVDEDGTYSYDEMEKFEFVYDIEPNIKFTYADIIGTREVKSESASRAAPGPGGEGDGDDDDDEDDDEDDSDKKEYVTEFIQYFDIKGSLWIKQIDYVKDEGTPTFETQSGQPMKDKSYTTKGTIKYNAKMPNISAITRYSITLRNGRQVQLGEGCYSNKLYWSGENKITNVDWR